MLMVFSSNISSNPSASFVLQPDFWQEDHVSFAVISIDSNDSKFAWVGSILRLKERGLPFVKTVGITYKRIIKISKNDLGQIFK